MKIDREVEAKCCLQMMGIARFATRGMLGESEAVKQDSNKFGDPKNVQAESACMSLRGGQQTHPLTCKT